MSSVQSILRLGVDVGGTNTDAVLLDLSEGSRRGQVLASAKRLTTADVTLGIQNAIESVLTQAQSKSNIQALCIGTTHFVNALVERDPRRLDRVAVIRLCGPFTHGTPPFVGFPHELRELLEGPHFLLSGGLQIDGSEIASIVVAQVESACDEINRQGIHAVVVSSVFAPIDFEIQQEKTVAAIVRKRLPGIDIVCSKDVAAIGLLERENASILNAALLRYAKKTVIGFEKAAQALELKCPVFITSNDGTLLSCPQAARLPIRTFSSGPTNSMRGAAFLAALESGISKQSALVVDIGGTTTDIGMLLPSGFPRQAAAHHEFCGVLLNFSMPHVTSIGLGGGSIIRKDPITNKVTVGPDSVGHRIASESLVFGGSTLTATDVVVAAGRASNIGDESLVSEISQSIIEGAQSAIKKMLQNYLDAMKTSSQDIPVYLVGGGSILAPDVLTGISRVHRFPHFDVANAVGAAIAQISGIIDSFEDTSTTPIVQVRADVEARAIAQAIASGADPHRVAIVESEVIPIAYTTGRCRFYVKAAGDWSGLTSPSWTEVDGPLRLEASTGETASRPQMVASAAASAAVAPVMRTASDILEYEPRIEGREWLLSEIDLEWIADGCYVLGCGGGGSPLHTFLELRELVRSGDTARVIDFSSVASNALVGWGGSMGSPEVSSERLLGNEYQEASMELWSLIGIAKPEALCGLEIGGANGMINMILGSTKYSDIPCLDGDFMGRAYPTFEQTTVNVYDDSGTGAKMLPNVISSGDGSSVIMKKAKRDIDIDACLRAVCVVMGTHVGLASCPLKADYVDSVMIKNTVSLSWRIGRAIALARKQSSLSQIGPILVDAVGGSNSAKVLFMGKISDVRRRLFKGHTLGEVVITALAVDDVDDDDPNRPVERFTGTLTIPFKNENLYAEHTADDAITTMVATVPDLIAVLDAQNGSALGTPEYKYGLRVLVLGITAAPQWTSSERGIALGGPSAFGFTHIPYKPLGKYSQPRSVIEEYARNS
ncbi:hydantoinase [Suillus clintonianus]|uniref:hydantoinase n=1 Tax=Suillus clintonianus TaxID=1904413 RepID=UPI001B869926|nr:hydantoinase [Suillus clintonianus]KAG2143055.1 hydantoinase [Suillus clintonianus]